LSVKHTPDDAIPEAHKRVDDGGKVSTASAREEARDILGDNPSGASLTDEAMELPPERAVTVASQAATVSCHAVVLAGETS
jgi:hypothetical protein